MEPDSHEPGSIPLSIRASQSLLLAEVLIEIFGKAKADRILSRLTFHYTPLHSAWLNMAEIELRDNASAVVCPMNWP
jgi:hypothetical protein